MKKFIFAVTALFVLSIGAFAQDKNVKAYFNFGNEFDTPGRGKVFGGGVGADYTLLHNESGTAKLLVKGDVVLNREPDNRDYGLSANARLRAYPCEFFFVQGGVNKARSRGLDFDSTSWAVGGGVNVKNRLLVGYDRNFKDNIRNNSGLVGVTGNRVFTEAYLPLSEKFRWYIGTEYSYSVFNRPLVNDRARGFSVNLGLARVFHK